MLIVGFTYNMLECMYINICMDFIYWFFTHTYLWNYGTRVKISFDCVCWQM